MVFIQITFEIRSPKAFGNLFHRSKDIYGQHMRQESKILNKNTVLSLFGRIIHFFLHFLPGPTARFAPPQIKHIQIGPVN